MVFSKISIPCHVWTQYMKICKTCTVLYTSVESRNLSHYYVVVRIVHKVSVIKRKLWNIVIFLKFSFQMRGEHIKTKKGHWSRACLEIRSIYNMKIQDTKMAWLGGGGESRSHVGSVSPIIPYKAAAVPEMVLCLWKNYKPGKRHLKFIAHTIKGTVAPVWV